MTETPWPAPVATTAVDATVTIPGSKSVTNRALVLAALAAEPGWVRRPLRSRDSQLMADGLRALGVGIEEQVNNSSGGTGGGDAWRIIPAGQLSGPAQVDVGNAGTVMRFLPPLAALADGPVHFDGDPRSHQRPQHGVIESLRALGARIEDGGRGGFPLTVHGTGALEGGTVELDASASSQFVSALLLSGARYNQGVEVRNIGGPVPSLPHIRMTVDMLRLAGVQVDAPEDGGEKDVWRVTPGRCAAATWWSSPTCPTPRRSSPPRWSPAAGSPSATGPGTPPSRATGCARSTPGWAAHAASPTRAWSSAAPA